jgi:hypothetical protein
MKVLSYEYTTHREEEFCLRAAFAVALSLSCAL